MDGPEGASVRGSGREAAAAGADGSAPPGRSPRTETDDAGSATGACEPVAVVVAGAAGTTVRAGSGMVMERAGAAARPPGRPGVIGGQTTSASDTGVAAGLEGASEVLRSTRLRARRERRRGSEPEALAPSAAGTALVVPVTPLARVAPAGEAGLG